MGKFSRFLFYTGVVILLWSMLMKTKVVPVVPEVNQDDWWGPEELKGMVNTTVRTLKVQFTEGMIKDLKFRLKNRRPFTPPIEGAAFEYGFNTNELEKWVQYWANDYDFAAREKYINKYKHFATYIQGLQIHYLRIRPKVHDPNIQVFPLLLVHGWPGSFLEFYDAIPLLTTSRPGYKFVFEVIIPSIPGSGLSDNPARPGLAYPEVAVLFKHLMDRLNHKMFVVQGGGEWGARVASSIATFYPEAVIGLHTNFAYIARTMLMTLIGAYMPSLVVESHLADRMYPLYDHLARSYEQLGYFHLQTTKPDTIAHGLNDSPSGLLAYVVEKFLLETDYNNHYKPDGGASLYSKDQLIDNVMLFWVTRKIGPSMRFFFEGASAKTRALGMELVKTVAPTWAYQAKHEFFYQPPNILRYKYLNLLNVTVDDEGGHFLAMEKPRAFASDIFLAVQAFKEYHMAQILRE